MKDMQLLAAMAPPGGGRNHFSQRVLACFATINVTAPNDNQLKRIFGTILNVKLGEFDDEVKPLADPITMVGRHTRAVNPSLLLGRQTRVVNPSLLLGRQTRVVNPSLLLGRHTWALIIIGAAYTGCKPFIIIGAAYTGCKPLIIIGAAYTVCKPLMIINIYSFCA